MTSAPTRSQPAPPPARAAADMQALALEFRTTGSRDHAAWDSYVAAHPESTFFHRAGWRRAIGRVMGHGTIDLIALRGERIVGVLPLMECPRPFGPPAWISSPYAVYGGAIADDAATAEALTREAMRRADAARIARLELRHVTPAPVDLPTSELYATFVQDLPETPEEVLGTIPKKARAEARKARDKHGLSMSEGIWYLDDLHRMFQLNKRSLGSPGLPIDLFSELGTEFGDDVKLHLVRRGREPLMAVMSFVWRDRLLAYYAGTAPGADRAFSVSNYMYLALREWAVEQGLRSFDFGRSRKDSGAFQFKRHQGFEPTDLHYAFHLVRARGLPSFTPSNPRTKVLRDAWSRMPLWLAERLSRSLARYLP